MTVSLSNLRKARGLTQEGLGILMAARLGRTVEAGWGQKRISRFEAGEAEPTVEELRALATELGVDPQIVLMSIKSDAPGEAATVFRAVGSSEVTRSLMVVCCLSRSRAQSLDESFAVMRDAIERGLTLCAFIPYPNTLHLPDFGDHAETLASYYRRIRKSVSDANLLFKNRLPEEYSDRIALYFPRSELITGVTILTPPIFRQFSLTIEESKSGTFTKTLLEWTPSTEKDISRPILATGVHSLDEQIEAWEAYFGGVVSHWIGTNELIPTDGYWERIR
jgi:transcriptional regulator with XRE-family HTH domain